jgi:hypothetical protein
MVHFDSELVLDKKPGWKICGYRKIQAKYVTYDTDAVFTNYKLTVFFIDKGK